MKAFILSLLVLFTFLVSCRQDDGNALENKVNSVDVYVAGIENN